MMTILKKHSKKRMACSCSSMEHFKHGTKSVSYTHLDVYKRQDLCNTVA